MYIYLSYIYNMTFADENINMCYLKLATDGGR